MASFREIEISSSRRGVKLPGCTPHNVIEGQIASMIKFSLQFQAQVADFWVELCSTIVSFGFPATMAWIDTLACT